MKPLCKAFVLIVPVAVFLPGCPFECGAYSGAGDTMYRRGDDVLFLCRNAGFTLAVGTRSLEGRYEPVTGGFDGASGETGARAFSLQLAGDGSATSPELGAGWNQVALDKTALDHADVQCTDLETRAWWAMPADALPVATVFTRPGGGFHTTVDCQAAQRAGTYPATAKCEDGILLCPDNRATMMSGGSIVAGAYSAAAGEVSESSSLGQLDGVFAADGTLHSGGDVWQQVPVDQADPDLVSPGCAPGK